jgi:hypothetical protein
MKRKGLILGISLVLFLVVTTVDAQARRCHYYNPAFVPLAVAGAVVGTTAAITAAVLPPPVRAYPVYRGPVYPVGPPPPRAYYAPRPYYAGPVWVPGHYNRYGAWIHGHWR